MNRIHFSSAVLALSSLSCAANAADNSGSWDMQIGPAYIDFHEKVSLSAAGTPVPGAAAKVKNNTTLAAEITYRFTPEWSVAGNIGIPPTTDVTGTGTAEPFGKLGSVRYAPFAVTGKYTFGAGSSFRPYVGAGLVYYVVTKETDAFITSLKVDNATGSALQAGFQYDLTPSLGLFADVKKFFIKTTASGSLPALGGAPAKADIRLDPLALHAGVVVRF